MIFYLIPFMLIFFFFHFFLFYFFPYMGEDFASLLPPAFEMADYMKSNLGIMQWSRMCGGLPYFAFPQSSQFSFFTFFTMFFSPKYSWIFTQSIFILGGYLGTYLFVTKILKYTKDVAHCTSLLFISIGFNFAHLAVGHSNFMNILWIPLILYFLYSNGHTILAALLSSSFVYQGSFFTTPLLFANILFFYFFYRKIPFKKILLFGVLFFLFSLVKLYGNVLLVPLVKHDYILPYFNKAFNALKTSISMLFFPSFYQFLGEFKWQSNWAEVNHFISPVALVPIVFYLRYNKVQLSLKSIIIGIICLLIMLLSGAYVHSVQLLHKIPVLKNYWVVQRDLSLLIIPIIFVFSHCFHHTIKYFNPRIFSVLIALSFIVNFYILFNMADKNKLSMNYRVPEKYFSNPIPKIPKQFSIDHYSGTYATDFKEFQGIVNATCYDVTFGFHHEGFKSKVLNGSILNRLPNNAKYFNFRHPACLIYPKENDCSPWDNVLVSDRENLDLFLENKQNSWKIGQFQRIAQWVSGLSILIGVIIVVFYKETV